MWWCTVCTVCTVCTAHTISSGNVTLWQCAIKQCLEWPGPKKGNKIEWSLGIEGWCLNIEAVLAKTVLSTSSQSSLYCTKTHKDTKTHEDTQRQCSRHVSNFVSIVQHNYGTIFYGVWATVLLDQKYDILYRSWLLAGWPIYIYYVSLYLFCKFTKHLPIHPKLLEHVMFTIHHYLTNIRFTSVQVCSTLMYQPWGVRSIWLGLGPD